MNFLLQTLKAFWKVGLKTRGLMSLSRVPYEERNEKWYSKLARELTDTKLFVSNRQLIGPNGMPYLATYLYADDPNFFETTFRLCASLMLEKSLGWVLLQHPDSEQILLDLSFGSVAHYDKVGYFPVPYRPEIPDLSHRDASLIKLGRPSWLQLPESSRNALREWLAENFSHTCLAVTTFWPNDTIALCLNFYDEQKRWIDTYNHEVTDKIAWFLPGGFFVSLDLAYDSMQEAAVMIYSDTRPLTPET